MKICLRYEVPAFHLLSRRVRTLMCVLVCCISGTILLAQPQKKGMPMEQAATWKDMDGNPINAHGAGVLYYDGVYYLFGEIKKGPTRLVPGQSWEAYRVEKRCTPR
jgi:hypothetical protein